MPGYVKPTNVSYVPPSACFLETDGARMAIEIAASDGYFGSDTMLSLVHVGETFRFDGGMLVSFRSRKDVVARAASADEAATFLADLEAALRVPEEEEACSQIHTLELWVHVRFQCGARVWKRNASSRSCPGKPDDRAQAIDRVVRTWLRTLPGTTRELTEEETRDLRVIPE